MWALTEAEVVDRFVGRSDAHIRAEIATHLGQGVADGWAVEFRSLYSAALKTDLRPVDGVVEALDRIKTNICVASSSTHEHVRLVLGLTGLLPRFGARLFSATEVVNGKPAPDLFLLAAERLGIPPSACAVVEDSAPGVAAARSAGMAAFGYAGGVTPAHRLERLGVAVFHDMRELPTLLGEASGA